MFLETGTFAIIVPMQRESMPFDVVIVGAGPAGLAAAIRLRQLADTGAHDITVAVIEKGSEPGAHILSGAVFDARALDELLPDWKDKGAPLKTPATKDRFLLLTKTMALPLPVPPGMKNHGHHIVSLGNLTRWLAEQAETLGVEIFSGFAGAEVLFNETGAVTGVATGDMGRNKDGSEGPNFEPGVELHAKYTLFAEGCRGQLSEQVIERFSLRHTSEPQTYGLGIKELWEVKPEKHAQGTVLHTVGWPLENDTYGGSFLYHLEGGQVAVGFIVGLDYKNPHLSPFEEMQRFKTHPAIADTFDGAKRIAYGARALNEGGFQSIPKLVFPGGALVGAAAGFMNVARIKGSHTAMKSGMLAADAAFGALKRGEKESELSAYVEALETSWVWPELYKVRNIRPAFARWRFWGGLLYAALDTYLFRGHAPWTFSHHEDHKALKKAKDTPVIDYPKPDGVLTFDKLSSVFVSNTNHEENQPCHLRLTDEGRALAVNLAQYDGPEVRFCPAGVYEYNDDLDGSPAFRINAQNCIHCKTCDIKDPSLNITWTAPEGGGGPNYPNM